MHSFVSFQVKIWFQNRRTKWKKQENISNSEAAEYKIGGERHIDTVRQRQAAASAAASAKVYSSTSAMSAVGSGANMSMSVLPCATSPPNNITSTTISRDDFAREPMSIVPSHVTEMKSPVQTTAMPAPPVKCETLDKQLESYQITNDIMPLPRTASREPVSLPALPSAHKPPTLSPEIIPDPVQSVPLQLTTVKAIPASPAPETDLQINIPRPDVTTSPISHGKCLENHTTTDAITHINHVTEVEDMTDLSVVAVCKSTTDTVYSTPICSPSSPLDNGHSANSLGNGDSSA